MTEIAILVIVGVVLFSVFLRIAIQGPSPAAPDSSAMLAVQQMVNLRGLSFPGAQRLWDSAELEMLESTEELRGLAGVFRRERQTMALQWTGFLLDDVKTLWRFRRYLVRNGARASASEELQILQTAVTAVIFLNFLRFVLRLSSPSAFAGAARRARLLVETMSYVSACGLDRMPRTGWEELERGWQKSLA